MQPFLNLSELLTISCFEAKAKAWTFEAKAKAIGPEIKAITIKHTTRADIKICSMSDSLTGQEMNYILFA